MRSDFLFYIHKDIYCSKQQKKEKSEKYIVSIGEKLKKKKKKKKKKQEVHNRTFFIDHLHEIGSSFFNQTLNE